MKMYRIYGLNQPIIKKERFSIQLRPSPNKLASKSKEKDPKISQVEGLYTYEKIQKPTLNKEKLQRLKRQLALDEKAKKAFSKRKNQHNLFVNFDFNPFSRKQTYAKDLAPDYKAKNRRQSIIQNKQFSENISTNKENEVKNIKKLTNLIESMEAFRVKRLGQKIQGEEGFPLGQIKLFIPKVKANINRQWNDSSSQTKSPKNVGVKNENKSPAKSKRKDPLLFDDVMDFSKITSIKQKSFFVSKRKIDNIFQLVFNKDRNIIKGNQILDEYYFCHDSVKEITQSKKVFIYRDISKTARNFTKNVEVKEEWKMEFQDVREQHLTVDNIHIDSIFSVSAGRSSPEDVYNLMNERMARVQNQNDQGSSDQSDDQIMYSENTRNVYTQKKDYNEYQSQIEELNQIALDSNETKYKEYLIGQIQIFKKMLEEEINIKSLSIQDKTTFQKISYKKIQQLIKMLGLPKHKKQDIDRIIRVNKLVKNKTEQLKIKSLIEAFIIRREKEEQLNSKKRKASMA